MGENWLRDVGAKAGLTIWRLDNKSKQLSKEQTTTRCVLKSDDCYIMLDTKIDIMGGPSIYNVYSWIGSTTGIEDECNDKVAELTTSLGQECAHSRESQGHESKAFLGFFKQGIQYVEPLALRKQINLRDGEYPTRLYQLKGRRNARVSLVDLSHKSLNSGDVFILDNDHTIFQWNGKTASRMEKGKALDLTTRLRDERMNRLKAEIVVIKEGSESPEFWEAIGGEGPISPADKAGDDGEWEDLAAQQHHLYIVEPDYTLRLIDPGDQPFHRKHLHMDHSYIFDTKTQLFVWNGRNSPAEMKTEMLPRAKKFLEETNRPTTVPITLCPMGVEPALFRTHFAGNFTEYIDTPEAFDGRVKKVANTAGTLRQEKVNVDALLHPEKYAIAREEFAEAVPYAHEEGEIVLHREFKVFFVKKKQLHDLPLEEYGIFYSGQAYVVQYTVRPEGGTRRFVVYHWHGRNASVSDKGSASLLAQTLAGKFGRGCTLCRVVQNKEPDHFLSHFQGYMCVRNGFRDAWVEENKDKNKLYQIRGDTIYTATASQVEAKAHSLSSCDTYVLETPSKMWVWQGKGSNEHERVSAGLLVDRVQEKVGERERVVIDEDSEPEAFWEALGGKTPYSNEPHRRSKSYKTRLFQCTSRTGVFKVIEIMNFCQDDLDDDDIMLLDAFEEIFVWIGAKALKKEKEQEMAKDVAQEYIQLSDDGRDKECPIYVVDAGQEPIQFTTYFKGWNHKQAKSGEDLYSRKLQQVKQEGGTLLGLDSSIQQRRKRIISVGPAADETVSISADAMTKALNPEGLIVDFDRLRTKPTPEGVNGANLEAYLSDEQFAQFVKLSRQDFYALPNWKQLRHKKSIGLF